MPEHVALGCKHKCKGKSWHGDIPQVQSPSMSLGELVLDRVELLMVWLVVVLPLTSGGSSIFSFFPLQDCLVVVEFVFCFSI